jgi:hypothetical protein
MAGVKPDSQTHHLYPLLLRLLQCHSQVQAAAAIAIADDKHLLSSPPAAGSGQEVGGSRHSGRIPGRGMQLCDREEVQTADISGL